MLALPYTYESCIQNSEKVAWRLDDVMPPGTRLDFQKAFLPEALAGAERLPFLSDEEHRTLNQISGHAYVNLFAFVEEYILALAVQLAQAELFGDHLAIRALVRFADEEVKHQQLFHRYMAAFREGFGAPCEVLSSAASVAGVILGKSPISVLLTTLHIELMTQAHYVESVRGNDVIDPLFATMLHHHWLEESQHARIDALELDKLLDQSNPEQIVRGLDDYFWILDAFDGLLKQQAEMDVKAIGARYNREFSEEERAKILGSQHQGYRNTFLLAGMNNKMFREIVARIHPDALGRVNAGILRFQGA
jgi:hypothetical protein